MERLLTSRNKQEAPNALRSEHLASGIKPIIVCQTNSKIEVQRMFDEDESAVNVDHFAACSDVSPHEVLRNETKKIGVISEVDATNKFSNEYRNCVGLVVIGQDETGGNNSFLLHIDPLYLQGDTQQFSNVLSDRIEQIRNEAHSGTIDAVLFGGRIFDTELNADFDTDLRDYKYAIMYIGSLAKTSLGFEPVVIAPKPDNHEVPTSVYLDTHNRRLYLTQTPITRSSLQKPFLPSDVDNVTPKYISPIVDLPNTGPWTD